MSEFLRISIGNLNVEYMIRFVWFSLVCCGVANGAIYSRVAPPERYLYVGAVLLICFILVGVHRHFTKSLVDENRDYDEDHSPIFMVSAVIAVILALIALIAGFVAIALGLLTAGVGFILASIRESMYV